MAHTVTTALKEIDGDKVHQMSTTHFRARRFQWNRPGGTQPAVDCQHQ